MEIVICFRRMFFFKEEMVKMLILRIGIVEK